MTFLYMKDRYNCRYHLMESALKGEFHLALWDLDIHRLKNRILFLIVLLSFLNY